MIASFSILFDVGWVQIHVLRFKTRELEIEEGSFARAARITRVGVRTGRIIRLLRLVRLIRLSKLYKLQQENKVLKK